MKSIANAIAAQEPVEIVGRWQRYLPAQYKDRPFEARSSYGRWGRTRGFPVLYLARPTKSVVVEAYRHIIDPLVDNADKAAEQIVPQVLATASVRVTEILDLRTPVARFELELTMSQLESGTHDRQAYQACQQVAAAAHQHGFHGLIAPAATRTGETLVLFGDRLPHAEQPQLVELEPWDNLPPDPRQAGPQLSIVKD